MPSVAEETAFEKLLRPLGDQMSAEVLKALASMKADPSTQSRYEVLAREATENTLSESEREELEALVRANAMLSLLKIEARSRLQGR